MPTSHKRPPGFAIVVLALVALASVTFMGKSYETLLRGIDSNIHASVAMSVTADGMRPRLPIPIKNFSASAPAPSESRIDPNHYFNDHPFFLFWVNGLIMRALGPSAWSARLLTGLFSVGSVLLTLSLGSLLYSHVFGIVAALLLIFCRDFVLTSATMSLDTALVFFILLTFWFWQKRNYLGLGIAAGIGLWIKTPLVLLVFPTALIHDAIKGRLSKSFWRLVAAGLVAVAVGSVVWIYAGFHGGWDLVKDYWIRQLWGTAVGGRSQDQGTQWGFFFYYVRTGFLPGLPFLIIGLLHVGWRKKWRSSGFLVPAIAVTILAVVVTAMRFKLGHYVTPAFPFLALISAYSVTSWLQPREARLYSVVTGLAILVMMVLLVFPVQLAPEAFVALKRFMPIIQSHGGCDDRVVLVPGGEPVGSALDYTLALGFYTGRTVETVECSFLAAAARSAKPPQWIIVSHENLAKCLSADDRKPYTADFLMGDQHLLTTLVSHDRGMDLTPLEVELKAVTDCKAPPLPRDMWHHYLDK